MEIMRAPDPGKARIRTIHAVRFGKPTWAVQVTRERLRLRVMYAPDLRLDLWIESILR
jgi:hypothetical protein